MRDEQIGTGLSIAVREIERAVGDEGWEVWQEMSGELQFTCACLVAREVIRADEIAEQVVTMARRRSGPDDVVTIYMRWR